jgi:2-polyprenyl-3-methyl-5-hydroxy-6-metoxy-1,4-benzoquinol methylase
VLHRDPDKQWDSFGRLDPFYGVWTADEFRRGNLTTEAIERFYASGEAHVERLLSELDVRSHTALDFGCGTGRVLIPLARRFEHVVGVDVSPAMLAECRRACAERGVANVTLAGEVPDGRFDLVHSVMVLQHVPVRAGYRHVERLVAAVAPDGAIVLQLTLRARPPTRLISWLTNAPILSNLANVLHGRPWGYPSMQMNGYRLERVLGLLARRGCANSRITFAPPSTFFGLDSALIVARMPAAERQPAGV